MSKSRLHKSGLCTVIKFNNYESGKEYKYNVTILFKFNHKKKDFE